MEIIFQSIQGAASLLVILQILIICGISLGLISILIKKTKLSYEARVSSSVLVAQPNPVVASTEGTLSAETKNEEKSKELELLNIKIQELQSENEKIKTEKNEGQGLQDKIRYLETKLLEYEILQEEISTLSALKNENEQLKHKLQGFEGDKKTDAPIASSETQQPSAERDLDLRKEPVALKDPSEGKQAA